MNFETFCKKEYATVYRAALAFSGDREVALDATQEAFARAYARWPRLSTHAWAGGWVMTTALNLCRRRRRDEPVREFSISSSGDTAPEARLDIEAALRTLPLRQRQAILLHYLADLPVLAVAELMGASEGSVKTHLSRGRKALSRALTQGGST